MVLPSVTVTVSMALRVGWFKLARNCAALVPRWVAQLDVVPAIMA
jgi:hypothetical protein